MKLSRLRKLIFLHLQQLPMPSKRRPLIVKWGGVKFNNYKTNWVGENVTFDTTHPEDIIVEEDAAIMIGCIILTHFLDPKRRTFDRGQVVLKRHCYVGANTVICKPVTIGENAIIGAGSIVTKDIPANEIWAGNPARFIKKRVIECSK